MTVEEITGLLKQALESLSSNDQYSYHDCLAAARKKAASIPPEHPIHGELTLLEIFQTSSDPDKLLKTLQNASSKLRGRSSILQAKNDFIENNINLYTLWGAKPGRADARFASDGAYAQAFKIAEDVADVAYGLLELLQAHLAYYRGDIDEAYRLALACRENNKKSFHSESMIDIYALEIIANVAKHRMDAAMWHKSYKTLRQIAGGNMDASRSGCEYAQVVYTMMDLSLGLLHDVPVWGRTGELGAIPAPWGFELLNDSMIASGLPEAMFVHMQYLAYSGHPANALLVAGTLKDVFGYRNIVGSAHIEFMRAECYRMLDKPRRMYEALEKALSYVLPDRLYMIAAEFAAPFGSDFINVVSAHSPDAASKISILSKGYMDKLALLRNEVLKNTGEDLTKREREIASLAIQGCSNAEIAEKLNITVRTVRAHLEHIFDKFNVSRRSQLVSAIDRVSEKKLANWVK